MTIREDEVERRRHEEEDYRREHCPHGKRFGKFWSCQKCDVAGDLAFDAAREDRS